MDKVEIICSQKTFLYFTNKNLDLLKEIVVVVCDISLESTIDENVEPPVSPLLEPVSPLPEPVLPLSEPVSPLPDPVSSSPEPSETKTGEKSLEASDDQENISQNIKNDEKNSLWNDTSVKLMLAIYKELNPNISQIHEPSFYEKLWKDITKRLADAGYSYTTKQVENTYRCFEITSILSQSASNNSKHIKDSKRKRRTKKAKKQ